MATKKKVEAVEPVAPVTPEQPVVEAPVEQTPYEHYSEILAGRATLSASPVVPGAKQLPRIIGGKVEFDGLDYNVSPIYAHMHVACSYCGQAPRPDRTMHAYIPEGDNQHVIFVCSDYTCTNTHRKRFTQEGSILPQ